MHAEPTKYVHAQNATKLYFELTDVLRNCASRRCNCSSCAFHSMFVINNCTFIPFETHQHPIYITPLLDGQKIFFHPVHRQIFDQVYGQTCALILTVIVFPLYIWDMNVHGLTR